MNIFLKFFIITISTIISFHLYGVQLPISSVSKPAPPSSMAPFIPLVVPQGPVQVVITPESKYLLDGATTTFPALVEVTVGEQTESARQPVDLTIVLDVSGSMYYEQKMDHARQAILQIIENLHPQDTVSLVTYSTYAQVIFQKQNIENKNFMRTKILEIEPEGNTNLYDGLAKGFAQFKSGGSFNKKMLLFSDGQINYGHGEEDIFKFAKELSKSLQVSVYSYGIGLDFNEGIMRGVADQSQGTYFYIKDSTSIPSVLQKSFLGASNIVGTNAVLKLKGKSGGKILQVYGIHEEYDNIHIGDLKSGQKITLVTELDVHSASNRTILKYKLVYNQKGKQVELKGGLKIKVTKDPSLANKKNEKVSVYRRLEQMESEDKEIETLIDQQKFDEAEVLKRAQVEELEQHSAVVSDEHVGMRKKRAQLLLSDVESKDYKQTKKRSDYHNYLNYGKHERSDEL